MKKLLCLSFAIILLQGAFCIDNPQSRLQPNPPSGNSGSSPKAVILERPSPRKRNSQPSFTAPQTEEEKKCLLLAEQMVLKMQKDALLPYPSSDIQMAFSLVKQIVAKSCNKFMIRSCTLEEMDTLIHNVPLPPTEHKTNYVSLRCLDSMFSFIGDVQANGPTEIDKELKRILQN